MLLPSRPKYENYGLIDSVITVVVLVVLVAIIICVTINFNQPTNKHGGNMPSKSKGTSGGEMTEKEKNVGFKNTPNESPNQK